MADERFHRRVGPFTLGELAERVGGEVADQAAVGFAVSDVAALETAGPGDLTFLSDARYRSALTATRASAVVVRREDIPHVPGHLKVLVSPEPYRSFARIGQIFYPRNPLEPGIAATAMIAPDAVIGDGARIEAGAVIHRGVRVGARCLIGANVVIHENCILGAECEIGALSSITHAVLGNRVQLLPGVRIGQPGFGFIQDSGRLTKLLQLGRVIIQDDVEIGANSTVDRGASGDTVIGMGTMIDNLCQIGHNVVLGRGCILSAQVGISGSTRIGDFVMMGGQVGIADHLTIGDRVRIAAKSGVMRDIPAGQSVCGSPALPIKQFFRQVAALGQLAKREGA